MTPLFTSTYSIGKSILTFSKKAKEKSGPDSILDIADEGGLKNVYVVDTDMAGFWEAFFNLEEKGIQLNYGLRLPFTCGDPDNDRHFNVVFCRDQKGYFELIKLHNICKVERAEDGGLHYSDLLRVNMDHLLFCVPFYDSFLYNNTLTLKKCIPDINVHHIVFWEDNDLPFDKYAKEAVDRYCGDSIEKEKVKTIYYKNRDDYDAWVTLRCMNNRGGGKVPTLEEPNLEHCCSKEFCWEAYLENK